MCVDRLVALAIVRPIVAADVGRQGDVPQALDHVINVARAFGGQAHAPAAEEAALEDFRGEPHARRPSCVLEQQARTRLQFLSRVHKRIPLVVIHAFEQQALGGAAAGIAAADESRWKHARVIGHDAVPWMQQVGQVPDAALEKRPRRAIDDEQAGRAARARLLGDERVGEGEVEVRYQRHGSHHAIGGRIHCHHSTVNHNASATGIRASRPKTASDNEDERVVRACRPRARPRVAFEQRQVIRVRPPEDVADRPGHRHGADERVDERVEHHPQHDDLRHPLVDAVHEKDNRERRARQIANAGNEGEQWIEPETNPRTWNRESRVEEIGP